jgi:hypothetical protein
MNEEQKKEGVPMITHQERTEVLGMVWDNYYTLATSATEAMAIIWDEYANGALAEFLVVDHNMTENDILDMLVSLTKFVKNMPAEDRRKSAMEVYAERNRKV